MSALYYVLRRAELVAAGARADGIALYDTIAALQGGVRVTVRLRSGERVSRLRTDRVRLRLDGVGGLWLAALYPGHTSWLRERMGMPSANLSGANLSGANLSGANLSGADLRSARRHSHDPIPAGWTYADGVLVRGAR